MVGVPRRDDPAEDRARGAEPPRSILRSFYEELWERLPEDLEPPDFERRRALLLAHVEPGQQVLDLGCGAGAFAAAAAGAGAQVTGVDVAEAALERARRAHPEISLVRAEEERPLPLGDSSFDIVWASEVLEHVADTARFLSEARRVLRTGGTLLVTTPAWGRLRLALRGPPGPLGDDLRLYTRRTLATTLEAFGFGDVRLKARGGSLHASARRAAWRGPAG
jgi:2-polyprenyl-3-methyl-5-hydroxy-6-metoxy-1,4-benzoquinol methylase